MKVFFTNYKIQILISFIFSIYCVLEEGNIYIPMASNFTLEHSQSRINNKNYYTIPLKVGTPEEEYELQVDTSTATTWIASEDCKNCFLAHRLYEEQYSRTSSPTDKYIKIEDEDGNVEGYQISDNIKLGGYKLKQFGFVQVTKIDDNFRDHHQGKLGLGYRSHYLKDDEFNFLEKLKNNNLIVKKIFTINAINERKGMLFIGDTPGKEYNTYCNVTTDTDELDEMYKESWVCHLTHIGIFELEKGIPDKIKYYDEIENNNLVNFDSAYDYIAVPISEKQHIQKLLDEADLDCRETKKNKTFSTKDQSLRNRIREREITILCKTTPGELKHQNISLSFVLGTYTYSLPLYSLFNEEPNYNNEMEMVIKIIEDPSAIWTFGYPFMNQFLMIFNMEENHVGIKKLRKTQLPIVLITDEIPTNKNEENSNSSSGFKTFGYFILVVVLLAAAFFIYHFIRKKNTNSESITNKDNVY